MFVSLCRRVVSIFSQGPVFSSQDRPRIGEEVIKQRRNSPTKVLFGFLWPNRLGNTASDCDEALRDSDGVFV